MCCDSLAAVRSLNLTFVSAQVDEHSVFRHRGERKVKTLEEDTEEVASKTAELLNEEGEELMGKVETQGGCCDSSIGSASHHR